MDYANYRFYWTDTKGFWMQIAMRYIVQTKIFRNHLRLSVYSRDNTRKHS